MSTRSVTKEMGITHADFFRLLPVALGTEDYAVTPTSATAEAGSKSVRIDLGPEGTRQIALLALPQTTVTIALDGYDDEEAEAFMVRFDRAYQRGGG